MYENILVALDGSVASGFAGKVTIELANALESRITVCHVYGIDIHRSRFSDMEPGLPEQYQEENKLIYLRSSHDKLMSEGFRALSIGYVEDFVASCKKLKIPVESVAIEGRSYTGILQLATEQKFDLIILGATGLGAIGDGLLGGTTSRILYNSPCDLLIIRSGFDKGPILTGVDGSEEALKAVNKAAFLGSALNKCVNIIAAYDPVFHTRVFDTIAGSFSNERKEEIGLAEQEKLHNDIINEGLEKLYAEFLHQAEDHCRHNGISITSSLVTGKAYNSLNLQAEKSGANSIVLSRHGNHSEQFSIIGSNTENLLRTTKTNVLVIGGVKKIVNDFKKHKAQTIKELPSLTWEPDAQALLKRVPVFARKMAKHAVESAAQKSGKQRVSAEDFQNIAAQFGMGQNRSHK